MLIAQGKILYQNAAHKSVDYFAEIGYPCPDMCNPADYFMTMLSAENAVDDDDESDERIVKSET